MPESQWPHFSEKELTCRCGCGKMQMDPEFLDRLESLRTVFDRPMVVTSAFRCPTHNAYVSESFTGPHTTGKAIDIAVAGQDAYDLLALAIHHNFPGIGLNQRGDYDKRFIHLDILDEDQGRPRPRVWTY